MHTSRLDQLQTCLQDMSSQYKSAETTSLGKDIAVLKKKEDATEQKAKKIEDSLEHALQQHAEEAKLEAVRWLTQARDKVVWCSDVSGDKYRCIYTHPANCHACC